MTIINTIKTKLSDSFLLTVIYTIGHFLIAILCVYFITGATIGEATLDAVIEPLINAAWFYILHKLYLKYKSKK